MRYVGYMYTDLQVAIVQVFKADGVIKIFGINGIDRNSEYVAKIPALLYFFFRYVF